MGYHVLEFRLHTGDGGEVELSLRCGKPEFGLVWPEGWKAQRRPAELSGVSCMFILWPSSSEFPMRDIAGLFANDDYSTPTVNNIYCSSSSCTGTDIQRVLERFALVSQVEVH